MIPLDPTQKISYDINLKHLNTQGAIRARDGRDVVAVDLAAIQTNVDGSREFVYSRQAMNRKDTSSLAIKLTGVEMARRFSDIDVGNDAYIFGYPSSIGVKTMPQLLQDQPLLRKGTIAGKNPEKKTIILDAPVYYGNSGGPVLEVLDKGLEGRSYRIVGVVSEFVPFAEEWENKKHQYVNLTISNSGYSVIEPIDFVLELIARQ